MYKLRPYQQDSVDAAISHFKKSNDPAVIVLPTGAGKSLVIAQLAKIAKGRVLILAHVKELVEQNHEKYQSYDLVAGIYSAGLGKKEADHKVIFGSIQSIARAPKEFFQEITLVIIDECHRVSLDSNSQYRQVINLLKENNKHICILGLTATPYRMGLGWIYSFHYEGKLRNTEDAFFKKCIFELSLSFMIKNNFLTTPIKIDAPVACYDFSSLKLSTNNGSFSIKDVQAIFNDQERVTPGIIEHIIQMSSEREGVMLFTSTIKHAQEILELLPKDISVLVTGETPLPARDQIISDFKKRKIKFLVNVSVLTTGFDAPHVDLIAMLRPTESVGLYQQIIGRGLRLSPGKEDCLILDYTGQGHNIFSPEIGGPPPTSESVAVVVLCPSCGHQNDFWGLKDESGIVIEHYGRKCQGAFEEPDTSKIIPCDYRFRFKICEDCGAKNDIAARICHECDSSIVDTEKKLKEAMQLKDAHIMKPDTMTFEKSIDKKGNQRLEISYYDFDANALKEYYYLDNNSQTKSFYYKFTKMHSKLPGTKIIIKTIDDVISKQELFRMPQIVLARKKKFFWEIREKIF